MMETDKCTVEYFLAHDYLGMAATQILAAEYTPDAFLRLCCAGIVRNRDADTYLARPRHHHRHLSSSFAESFHAMLAAAFGLPHHEGQHDIFVEDVRIDVAVRTSDRTLFHILE
jgi:hypothetical protein